MKAFKVTCTNLNIQKTAVFLIYGESKEAIYKKFEMSFVYQSGMRIDDVTEFPDWYLF
jgi:hypothetical protein